MRTSCPARPPRRRRVEVGHRHRVGRAPGRAAPRRRGRWSARTSPRARRPWRSARSTPSWRGDRARTCRRPRSPRPARGRPTRRRAPAARSGRGRRGRTRGRARRRHRRAQLGGHVVQPGRRRHPPGGTVGAGPLAAQPPVGAEVGVEPGVAVGRGDPLGLAPGRAARDQRVGVRASSRSRQARVSGTSMPMRGSSELTWAGLRRSKRLPGGRVASTAASRAVARRSAASASRGRGPDERGDELLGDGPVHRQAVGRQLGAQQLGGRLRARRRRQLAPARQPRCWIAAASQTERRVARAPVGAEPARRRARPVNRSSGPSGAAGRDRAAMPRRRPRPPATARPSGGAR